jgi:hypothetical protein
MHEISVHDDDDYVVKRGAVEDGGYEITGNTERINTV